MLCKLLELAGCGRPRSYFRWQSIRRIANEIGIDHEPNLESVEFSRLYLDGIRAQGEAGTGLFGLRIMYENLGEMLALLAKLYPDMQLPQQLIASEFGQPLYISLSREDKVAQAVSLFKAEQTGLWHIAADGSEIERTGDYQDAVYDADRISILVDEIARHDREWQQWFLLQGIEPLRLTYEHLTSHPQSDLQMVLEALGRDTWLAAAIATPTGKLGDKQSADWIEWFKAERGLGS
jgi:LPS sulfotransferase NodH